MEQSQTRALTALQPFIHLAITTKDPSPRFLADLVTRAISSPQTYVFTELLQTSAIQSLRSSKVPAEFQAYLRQLEQFAWGTWAEYQGDTTLPPLSDAQALKLRQLTLLSLAATSTPLTYETLMKELALSSAPELEAVITSAIYSFLLTARLSPATNPPMVHVTSVAPLRDLRPASLSEMLKIIQTWESRCSSVISELEQQITAIKTEAAAQRIKDSARQEIVDQAVLNVDGGAIRPGHGSKGHTLRSGGDIDRRGKGVASGSKRDLQEQQGSDGYGEEDGEDGGVGIGVAKMEVDEGSGAAMGKSEGPTRASKRFFGKKG